MFKYMTGIKTVFAGDFTAQFCMGQAPDKEFGMV